VYRGDSKNRNCISSLGIRLLADYKENKKFKAHSLKCSLKIMIKYAGGAENKPCITIMKPESYSKYQNQEPKTNFQVMECILWQPHWASFANGQL